VQIVRFKTEHAEYLLEQAGNKPLLGVFTEEVMAYTESLDHAYTGLLDGEPVLCAGLVKKNDHCAEAWTILHQNKRDKFILIFNALKRFLQIAPYRRVEALIKCDFNNGHRWAKALGFKLEASRMYAYNADGSDSALYSRINKWV